MSAEELQIGDWVTVIIDGYKYPSRITKLDGDTEDISVAFRAAPNDWENGDMFDDIEPIPLTKEILEKNGFELENGMYEECYVYSDDDRNCRICVFLKETNYTNGSYTYVSMDVGCVCITELPIQCVHEFQHILRVCGIDINDGIIV